MATFSRGFGLGIGLSQRLVLLSPKTASYKCARQPISEYAIHAIRRSPIIQAARNLQTSARLRAQKQTTPSTSRATAPKVSRTPFPPQETTSRAPKTPSSWTRTGTPPSVPERLAARGKPTVLYECPSHFWLHFSSFAAASFCIVYAVIHYWSFVANPPEGLAWWIPPGFALICIVMGLFGVWFLYSSAFIVRRITAVPTDLLTEAQLRVAAAKAKDRARPQNKARAKAPGKTSAADTVDQLQLRLQTRPIMLECEVSSLIPLLQPNKVVAAPNQVLLPFKFADLPMAKEAGNAMPPPPRGVIGSIARPFQALVRGVGDAFHGLRRGLLRNGFAPVRVKGMRYKIDVTGGKLFEKGRVLDHVVTYGPGSLHQSTWQEKVFII